MPLEGKKKHPENLNFLLIPSASYAAKYCTGPSWSVEETSVAANLAKEYGRKKLDPTDTISFLFSVGFVPKVTSDGQIQYKKRPYARKMEKRCIFSEDYPRYTARPSIETDGRRYIAYFTDWDRAKKRDNCIILRGIFTKTDSVTNKYDILALDLGQTFAAGVFFLPDDVGPVQQPVFCESYEPMTVVEQELPETILEGLLKNEEFLYMGRLCLHYTFFS